MDRAQIRHVAELAELELTEAEEERLVGEIGGIVAYFAELDAIDTEGVPPTAIVTEGRGATHAGAAPLREDRPEPCLAHDEALAGAPAVAQGGFAVPTFVE